MTIPGSNLLNMAMGLIGAQRVQWLRFDMMATNAAGVDVPGFLEPVEVTGSFQAVSANLIKELGLDFTRNYATFFASQNFGDVNRGKTGDRLIYAGRTYQIESETPWFSQDGWKYVLCVELTNV